MNRHTRIAVAIENAVSKLHKSIFRHHRRSAIPPPAIVMPCFSEPLESRTLLTGNLPGNWIDGDIGAPTVAGSSSYSAGAFTLASSSTGIDSSPNDVHPEADQFHYVYQPVSGDQTTAIRVSSQTGTAANDQAGIVFRTTPSTDPNAGSDAATVALFATGDGRVILQYRDSDGYVTALNPATVSASGPLWLKLSRADNSINGYYSTDDIHWNQVGSTVSVALGADYLSGLAVASGDSSFTNTATFDHYSAANFDPTHWPNTLSITFEHNIINTSALNTAIELYSTTKTADVVPADPNGFSYDSSTDTAVWSWSPVESVSGELLPLTSKFAWYQVDLDKAAITYAADGQHMPTDLQIDCPVLMGDANLDGQVDATDYNTVISHFGMSGKTWSAGSFSFDGNVDSSAYASVIDNFGIGLTAPAALSAAVDYASPQTAIDLQWHVPDDGAGYTIQRSVSGGAFSNLASSGFDIYTNADGTITCDYTDAGLSDGTLYSYRLRRNGKSFAPRVDVTTQLIDPTDVTATALDATDATVGFTYPGTNASGLLVYAVPDGASLEDTTPTPVAIHSGNSNYSVTVPNLSPSTNYTIYVSAHSDNADSALIVASTITTPPQPLAPLLQAPTNSATSTSLAWTYAGDISLIDAFLIERSENGGDFQAIATVDPSTTSYTDPDVLEGTETYRVSALDAYGDITPSSTASTTVTPSLSINGPSSVNEGATYTLNLNFGHPVGGWTVDWGDGNTDPISSDMTSITHVYMHDTTVQITATAGGGNQPYSASPLNVTVNHVDPTLTIAIPSPDLPADIHGIPYRLLLSSTEYGGDTISSWTINWGDGNSQTVTGNPYDVSHAYGPIGGQTYTVSATATDQDGTYSANTVNVSTVMTGVPCILSAAGTSTSAIHLSWSDTNPGTAYYLIDRRLPTDAGFIPLLDTRNRSDGNAATLKDYVDSTVPLAGSYVYYRVRAVSSNGDCSPYSNLAVGKTSSATSDDTGSGQPISNPDDQAVSDGTASNTTPDSPWGITAVLDKSDSSGQTAHIGWTLSSGGTPPASLNLYRSDDGGQTYTRIKTGLTAYDTTHSDTGLAPLTTYSYALTTIDTSGNESVLYPAGQSVSTPGLGLQMQNVNAVVGTTPDPKSRGAFITMNTARDANGNQELNDSSYPGGDPNLVELDLTAPAPTTAPGKVTLTVSGAGAANIKIWKSKDKSDGTVISPGTSSVQWNIGQMPGKLYVEGIAQSQNPGDIVMTLAYTPAPSALPRPVRQVTLKASVIRTDPIVIGFYGADAYGWAKFVTYPFAHQNPNAPNPGNEAMVDIGNDFLAKGLQQKTYWSLQWHDAFQDLWSRTELDWNHNGIYDPGDPSQGFDPERKIYIYGHSWGGLSAILLAQRIQKDPGFKGHNAVDILATVDPVDRYRNDFGGVPANVKTFWNRYETETADPNQEISIGGVIHPHGYAVASLAQVNDVLPDLNPTGTAQTALFGNYPIEAPPSDQYRFGVEYQISHFTIIGAVKSDLESLLEQP